MKRFVVGLLVLGFCSAAIGVPLWNSFSSRLKRVRRQEPAESEVKEENEGNATKVVDTPPGLGGTNIRFPICIYRLGVANRFVVRNRQITASSAYGRPHLQPHMGRLGNPFGSWCAGKRHRGPHFMQIDLGRVLLVSGVITQGATHTLDFVTLYRVSYSIDGQRWTIYKDSGQETVFRGYYFQYTNHFSHRVAARFIKILPMAIYGRLLCMRAEVIGCSFSQVNLARNTTAEQSSTKDGAVAARAIDGKFELNFNNDTCSLTKTEDKPWWRVDLGYSTAIRELFIAGPQSGPELTDFEVRIGESLENNGNDNEKCGEKHSVRPGEIKTITCNLTGQYINIRVPESDRALSLCEVVPYGMDPKMVNYNPYAVLDYVNRVRYAQYLQYQQKLYQEQMAKLRNSSLQAQKQGQQALSGARQQGEQALGKGQQLVGQGQSAFGGAVGQGQAAVGQGQAALGGALGQGQAALSGMQGQGQQAWGQAQGMLGGAQGQGQQMFNQLQNQGAGLAGQLQGQGLGMANQFQGQFQNQFNQLQGQGLGMANQLQGQFQNQFNQLQGQGLGMANQLQGQFQNQFNQLQSQGAGVASQVQNQLGQFQGQGMGLMNQLQDQGMGLANRLQGQGLGLANQFQGQGMGMVNQLQGQGLNAFNNLQGQGMNLANDLKGQGLNVVSDLSGTKDDLMAKAKDFYKKLKPWVQKGQDFYEDKIKGQYLEMGKKWLNRGKEYSLKALDIFKESVLAEVKGLADDVGGEIAAIGAYDTDDIKGLLDNVDKDKIKKLVQRVRPLIPEYYEKAKSMAMDVFNQGKEEFDKIRAEVEKEVESAQDMGAGLIGDATQMGRDMSSQATGLGNQLRDRGMSAVGQAQQTGMGALQNLQNTGQGLMQQGQQSLNQMQQQGMGIFNQARQTGLGAFNQMRQTGTGAFGQLQNMGQQGLQQAQNLQGQLMQTGRGLYGQAMNMGGGLMQTGQGLYGQAQGLQGQLMSTGQGLYGQAQNIGGGLQNQFMRTGQGLYGQFGGLQNQFIQTGQGLYGQGMGMGQNFQGMAPNFLGQAQNFYGQGQNMGQNFYNQGMNVGQGFQQQGQQYLNQGTQMSGQAQSLQQQGQQLVNQGQQQLGEQAENFNNQGEQLREQAEGVKKQGEELAGQAENLQEQGEQL